MDVETIVSTDIFLYIQRENFHLVFMDCTRIEPGF